MCDLDFLDSLYGACVNDMDFENALQAVHKRMGRNKFRVISSGEKESAKPDKESAETATG